MKVEFAIRFFLVRWRSAGEVRSKVEDRGRSRKVLFFRSGGTVVWHASVSSKLHFGFWSIFVLLGKLQVMGYPNNMLLLCKVWFWILCDEHELGIFFISLYEIVNEWFLFHKFFCPTLSRLIFSGSDILTYRNIFCLANFGVKPHQRHADFYTKVIVKNWTYFETFLFSLLDI